MMGEYSQLTLQCIFMGHNDKMEITMIIIINIVVKYCMHYDHQYCNDGWWIIKGTHLMMIFPNGLINNNGEWISWFWMPNVD